MKDLTLLILVVNYLRSLNIDEPLARIQADGTTRYYQQDALGSVRALTDETGTVKTQYNYDPFGNTDVIGEISDNPFQFAGRENDGTGLLFERNRYLSFELLRYISEDPMGYAGGDINLFVRVGNNPVNFVDPLGLINVTKSAVGLINIGWGIYAGAQGASTLLIGVVALGSGAGWPFGVGATALAVYQFGLAMPGKIKSGIQQFGEGIDECEGRISFGSWHNLRGLGPFRHLVDDPHETYKNALEWKKLQLWQFQQLEFPPFGRQL